MQVADEGGQHGLGGLLLHAPTAMSSEHLVPPSLGACLYLLLFRWLARDYEAAFANYEAGLRIDTTLR